MSDINERLTYRNQYGVVDLFGAESSILREGLETEREVNALTAALEKLAAYEDAEEQGRLVRLPCAVGDTVYSVYRGDVEETKVQVITISKFGLEFQDGFHGNWVFHTDSIGKTVFLTRAEAEAALKGGA